MDIDNNIAKKYDVIKKISYQFFHIRHMEFIITPRILEVVDNDGNFYSKRKWNEEKKRIEYHLPLKGLLASWNSFINDNIPYLQVQSCLLHFD